ncbi:ABC transporter permease [Micromonospora sp. NPDC049799]|uniref:ABC transporter permease n=1 Tax=Micromonospora sp. NPDC049799 TaxID=3154741 RepID=UPI0033C380AF
MTTSTMSPSAPLRLAGPGTGASSAPVWFVFGGVFAVAWLLVELNGGQFMTVDNLQNMAVRSVALGLVAVGQTIVLIGGSLDLSVAYMVSVTAVSASFVMQGDPDRMALGIAVTLALGAGVGLVNGLVITRLRINAFIATLGTSLVMSGILNALFTNFTGSVPREFQALGYNALGPVPVAVLLLLAVVALAWYTLRRTRFGYHLYAVGGSAEVARLSGVRTDRVVVTAHVLCSLTAVLTGLFLVSRLRSGAPWVGPDGGYDLESIAAAVVGGTALAGGRGTVAGTLAGVLILAVVDQVFNEFEVNAFLKTLIRGVIIVGAVALYALRNRRDEEGF